MLVLFTASCAIWPAPQSPAQAVYMMKASFLVSLRAAEAVATGPAYQSDATRAKALAAAQGALDAFSASTAKLEEKS